MLPACIEHKYMPRAATVLLTTTEKHNWLCFDHSNCPWGHLIAKSSWCCFWWQHSKKDIDTTLTNNRYRRHAGSGRRSVWMPMCRHVQHYLLLVSCMIVQLRFTTWHFPVHTKNMSRYLLSRALVAIMTQCTLHQRYWVWPVDFLCTLNKLSLTGSGWWGVCRSLSPHTPLVFSLLLGKKHVCIRLCRAEGVGIIQQVLHAQASHTQIAFSDRATWQVYWHKCLSRLRARYLNTQQYLCDCDGWFPCFFLQVVC